MGGGVDVGEGVVVGLVDGLVDGEGVTVGLKVGNGVILVDCVCDCVGLLLSVVIKELEQLIGSDVEPLKEQAEGQLQVVHDDEPLNE